MRLCLSVWLSENHANTFSQLTEISLKVYLICSPIQDVPFACLESLESYETQTLFAEYKKYNA